MTTPSFIQASAGDVEAILTMMREYYTFDHLDFDESRARNALQTLIHDRSLGAAWLILTGDNLVGYLVLTFAHSLEFHGRFGLIDELYLRTSYRNQGLGKEALAFVQDFCISMGIKVLRLEVEQGNLHAQAVYRKFGFEAHDRYLMTRWVNH